jgi:PKHD-type hydroxylase
MFNFGYNNSQLTFRANSTAHNTYPYVSWDNIFNNEEIKDIVKYCDSIKPDAANIINPTTNSVIRKANIKVHTYSEDTRWMFEGFRNAIELINKEFFRFELIGFETFEYTVFLGKDSKYDFHMDMVLGDVSPRDQLTRKLSFNYILSDPSEYQGGNLEFKVAEDVVISAEQKKGRLIAFPSFMLNRISPITSGTRKSIIFHALGPKFK